MFYLILFIEWLSGFLQSLDYNTNECQFVTIFYGYINNKSSNEDGNIDYQYDGSLLYRKIRIFKTYSFKLPDVGTDDNYSRKDLNVDYDFILIGNNIKKILEFNEINENGHEYDQGEAQQQEQKNDSEKDNIIIESIVDPMVNFVKNTVVSPVVNTLKDFDIIYVEKKTFLFISDMIEACMSINKDRMTYNDFLLFCDNPNHFELMKAGINNYMIINPHGSNDFIIDFKNFIMSLGYSEQYAMTTLLKILNS